MTIIVSSKGQIVVPKEIRDRAAIDAGDRLEISFENGAIQLRKASEPSRQGLKIKINKKTGLPFFDVPKDAPAITDEWVKQQLSDFP